MARIASTRPRSTSSRAFSTIRAKNGKAPMVMGTTAAVLPRVVPTTSRVRGISAISSTTKGSERPRLTSPPNSRLSLGMGYRPPLRLMNSSTPRGRPINRVNSEASSTMYRVSPVAVSSSCASSCQSRLRFTGVHSEFLAGPGPSAVVGICRRRRGRRRCAGALPAGRLPLRHHRPGP